MNNPKLNTYIRIDAHGRDVSNSNILRTSIPKTGRWRKLNANECCSPIVPETLNLLFDDILNVPVADAFSLSDWNTFFSLPSLGTPFTDVEVVGNEVRLSGGSGINLDGSIFNFVSSLIRVEDSGSIISIGDSMFQGTSLISASFPSVLTIGNNCFFNVSTLANLHMPSLITAGNSSIGGTAITTANFPNLTTIADSTFSNCTSLSSIYIPSCTALGSTVGDNSVFDNIFGINIVLTVPAALMTCDGGSPDGDIVFLQTNDTVFLIAV